MLKVFCRYWRATNKAAIFCGFAFAACFLYDFYAARAIVPNADVVQNYNELVAIGRGNLFLRHWVLSADNFFLTDLPFFLILSAIFGDSTDLIFLEPFVVFAILVCVCAVITGQHAKSCGERIVGYFAILFLIALPLGPGADFMMQPAMHIATLVYCLLALPFARPFFQKQSGRRWKLILFSLPIFIVAVSDPFADVFFLLPLIVLVATRSWLRGRFNSPELLLTGTLIIAAILGISSVSVFGHNGGFITSSRNISTDFVPSDASFLRNIAAIRQSGMILFSAYKPLLPDRAGQILIAAVRAITILGVVMLNLRVILRMPRDLNNGVAQWLFFGWLFCACMEAPSATFAAAVTDGPGFPYSAIRYVTPIYTFMCLAAAIEMQSLMPLLLARSRLRLTGLAAAVLVVPLIWGAAQATISYAFQPSGLLLAPQQGLALWLEQNGLFYGVGDYWTSQMVLALSRGTVHVDPVDFEKGRLTASRWISDVSHSNRNERPQFVAFDPGNLFGISLASISQTFGEPVHVYHVDAYIVALIAR